MTATVQVRSRVYGKLRTCNRRLPPTLDAGLRRALTEGYRRNIAQLQILLNRERSYWLTV